MSDATLASLIDEQVARTPHATAVVFEGEVLTYHEFDTRARRVARALAGRGIGPGSTVALTIPRSLELVIAIHAVAKSGAAYVPVDPDYPAERIAYLLGDSAPDAVLTANEVGGLADADDPDGGEPIRPPHASDPAYVIYTSGSTGRPKGVVVPHSAIVNRLLWGQDRYPLGPGDSVLQKTPASFDISVWEFFWPLLAGARLVVAKPGGHRDPAYLARLIRTEEVTTAHFVPSMLTMFLSDPAAPGCTSLRRVLCSGEALPSAVARRFTELLPRSELHNLYGPTEAAVEVSHRRFDPVEDAEIVAMGEPVRDTRLYVLDPARKPVESGAIGELYIAGAQLAWGYHGKPGLTADRFVPCPFGAPGERMYQTGDLVRERPDGALEYLGRSDDQVKVRGFRVELGEIEAALLAHDSVGQAAAVLREDTPGDQRLVGYVTAADGEPAPDGSSLRAFVAESLPEHTVPMAVVVVGELPVTAHGKLDRKALPPVDWAGLSGGRSGPAESPLGRKITAVWAEVLGQDSAKLGADADFFAIGGHSLSATRLVGRLNRDFGVELPLRAVFDHRTPAALEPVIRDLLGRTTAGAPPITATAGTTGPAPLSPGQQRLWFLEQLQPGTGLYNVPSIIRLSGTVSETALADAFGALVARHDALRTVFGSEDGKPSQRVVDGREARLRVIRPPDPDAAAQAVTRETSVPFDLGADLPVRALLLRLGEGDCLLVITAHHIAVDAWSMDVLLDELSELYAYHAGEPIPMPAPPAFQYRDFVAWQRDQLSGPAAEGHLAYWKRALAGCPQILSLPTDRPRPPVQSYRGAVLWQDLPAELADAVRATARDAGTTPFMAMLAGFFLLLGRLSGQERFLVGAPIAGRSRPETESAIGFFVNQLALRADLTGDPTVEELLARVREMTLGAYAHQDLPFERLVEELRPERDLSRSPLCQVLFNHIMPRRDEWDSGGLRWRREQGDEAFAKLDLGLYVWEHGDRVRCQFIYNVDLFSRERMRGIADQYLAVLRALTGDVGRPLSRISLVTDGMRSLLPDPRRPVRAEPVPSLVSQVVATARSHSDRVALSGPDGTWTYRELVERTAATAEALRSAGVGRGDTVAVLGARTPWLPASVLAVLTAGAVAALLDPAYPRAWLERRMRRLRPAAVLNLSDVTLDGVTAIRPAEAGWSTVDDPWRVLEEAGPAGVSDAAFLLFTSGTTAEPKGVLSAQPPLCRFLRWQAERFGLSGADRFAVLSGLGHDPILRDCFAGLVVGGEVHFPPEEIRGEPAELAAWLRSTRITSAHLTPTLGTMLATATDSAAPELRWLFFGGEALSSAQVRSMARWAPSAVPVNFYGTTETPQAAGHFVASPCPPGPHVPIGRGTGEAQLLVVTDADLQAGVGEPGELVVRSPYLALRYLDDAGGDPFPANMFGQDPEDRIHRTGDLARYRPDGTVELAGRRDRQLNLRGHRIEPAQIEAVLTGHPDVWEAAVLASRGPRFEDDWLAAHVVPAPGGSPTIGELTAYLAEQLPVHQRPARLAITDSLPMTSNGKVDEHALRQVEFPAVESVESPAELDPVESALATAWEEVLGGPPARLDQSFFEVGHSLLATQYVVRVRRSLGVEVPLRQLFASPSVAALARHLRSKL
ncbi:amino acid adenylation domain-containing protein [Amycolatopsis sp. NPDC052450]|uniref:amino acid adenylation domain-containing protein n=1 Tax=Amycolatopsis sp. NPDC052450 TaxID=3363937 RepID=UPI0037CC4E13